MTTKEFNDKLNAKIAKIEKENKPLQIAVSHAMSLQSKRIFMEGKNKEGAVIGTYEGGEIYVNPKDSPVKFAGKGKTGKKGKTKYFESYSAFKTSIGRNKLVKTVDLFLFGNLLRNWSNAPALSGAKAVKVSANQYHVSLKQENIDKVERYGKNLVFGLSKTEKASFLNVLRLELNKALNA